MLTALLVIGAFWLGYLQAHMWPSSCLCSWLEYHSVPSIRKYLFKQRVDRRPEFYIDVKKVNEMEYNESNVEAMVNSVLDYQMRYCHNCKTYDGYDICMNSKNFITITDAAVEKCMREHLFKNVKNDKKFKKSL